MIPDITKAKIQKLVIDSVTGIFIFFMSIVYCNAQQLNPPETQFFINQYLANPAMAGLVNNELLINTSYRSQLDQVPGSPKTMSFTADYRFPGNVGIGLNLNRQQAGLLSHTSYMASYAYHIQLNEENNEHLHMGFSTGWSKDMIDMASLIGSANDPIVNGYNGNLVNWNVDAGATYEKNGFCIQVAAPNFNRTLNKKNDFMADYAIFYVAANYTMPLSDEIVVNPKIAFRGIQNYNNILDIGAELQFKEPFRLSAMYHNNQSFSAGFSYSYQTQRQLIGLYNTPTKVMQGLVNGIFEIGLRFRFLPGINDNLRN